MSNCFRLIVVTRGAQGRQRIYDFDSDEVRLGRDARADVQLPHASVSKLHARLDRRDGRVLLIDAGSANGTFVDGHRLAPDAPHELGDGAVFTVGDRFEVAYYAESPADAVLTGPEATADLARRLVDDLLATGVGGDHVAPGTGPELVGDAGVANGQRFRLPAPDSRVVVGRGATCDLNLIDPDLSREHVELRRSWNGVTVVDLGSKNGTHLNGARLAAHAPTALVDGDRLRAAACGMVFVDPAARYLAQLEALVGDVPGEAAAADELQAGAGAAEAGAIGDEAVPALDRSWAGRVVDPEAVAEATPAADDAEAPARRSNYLPSIVLALLVIGAVVGLVLLLAS